MELKFSENITVKYHNIFDYKLTKEEAIKWQYQNQKVVVNGRKNRSRLQREKYSKRKLEIAKKASKLISKVSMVKFVGITGALAMNNAGKNSDIDLMIVTKANTLWITRLYCYIILWLNGYKTRHPKSKLEKDKLCLNMWLDEQDLVWDKKDRNIYTAHEIAQIVPLVSKDKTYEKFLSANKWVLNFWPNSVRIRGNEEKVISPDSSFLSSIPLILEQFVFKLQYIYMKSKISREIVTPTRAIFHPNDWGKVVLNRLSS